MTKNRTKGTSSCVSNNNREYSCCYPLIIIIITHVLGLIIIISIDAATSPNRNNLPPKKVVITKTITPIATAKMTDTILMQTTATTGTIDSPTTQAKTTTTTASTTCKPKTIFLIRHAESKENHRTHCAKNIFGSIKKLSIPSMTDVSTSFELFNLPAQYDTELSIKGKEQVVCMGKVLQDNNFLVQYGIELVVHSPLIRARDTCLGMLQCSAITTIPSTTSSSSPDTGEGVVAQCDSTINNSSNNIIIKKPDSVQRVVQLDLVAEKSQKEWIPGMYHYFQNRLTQFEQWIQEQPESVIAVVGHSQYFKALLSLPYTFGNADVWQVTFQPQPQPQPQNQQVPTTENDTNNNNDNKQTKLNNNMWIDIKPIYKCADYFNIEPKDT